MAAKGDAFLLLLSLSLFSSAVAAEEPPPSLHDRQEAQLHRLEALVESLSETVSALESSLSTCSAPPSHHPLPHTLETLPRLVAQPLPEPAARGDRTPGVAVTKHKTWWSERFQFAAAARLEASASASASASAATVLPYEDLDGLSKYFAVGDTLGRVYVFSASGDVLIELPSISDSPVTSMLCYLSSRRYESLLFTGHADGSIAAHRLWGSAATGDDWTTISVSGSRPLVRGPRELGSPPVLGLEMHQISRTRYILATDAGGRIRVFTENGTLYGTAIASSRPLAFMKQRLLFLTETGAGSLDLRSMVVKETECEGLDGSVSKAYSFDSSEKSKAYGFTAGGDLIHVILLGDVPNLKCRVRAVRKSEIDGPVSIQTIKGYLLVASHDKVFVYNISSQYFGRVGAPRPLFFATIHEIKSVFLNSDTAADGSSTAKTLITADREKLVVLGFDDGYIGIYRSNFPVFKVETNAVVWSGSALLFLLFLIVIWQFYVKKKNSLGWAPEESFSDSGITTGVLLGCGASDRAYVDGRRGGVLRDPPRRYVSPPRYPGGHGIPFRTGSTDSSFRGPAELKFRGQSMEPTSFATRREPLFPNTPVEDDHID
ncbi:putative membrane protein [Cocos nucifera]|uniref:Putative membrane protein n=1 Tax=Cocos nucifera TaxID=13894 RepID=A0A8K0IHV0_COCNU|nr:putative membrane protein [Cocos nucifera]